MPGSLNTLCVGGLDHAPGAGYRPARDGTFIVRARSANPMALASTLRREIPRTGSEFRVTNIRTQEELVRAQTLRERLLAMLALFFAVVALLLAGIGLYGVLDYGVVQRRREIGIRVALGATRSHVLTHIIKQGLQVTALGVTIGLVAALAVNQLIASLLFGVQPTDTVTIAFVIATIAAVAVVASWLPAWRASRLDPNVVLREE